MMITLGKAHRGSYWWGKKGEVDIDPECVESMEQMYESGHDSVAYTLVTMKSGVQHKIYNDIHDLRKAVNK